MKANKTNNQTNSEGAEPMKDFSGKIAVITGGERGWGVNWRASSWPKAATSRCATFRKPRWPRPSGCARSRSCRRACASPPTSPTSRSKIISSGFATRLAEQQKTDRIHLLFNNAGIGGGGSLFTNTREQWERTFNICWGGVYLGVRTFLPMLVAADEAHIVNTASVNGFWASIGMGQAHTAYSSAKFAVKGFTEALINDLRLHAPHVKCSVVMPGHIGTSIVSNSRRVQSGDGSERLNPDEVVLTRKRMVAAGVPDAEKMSDEDIQAVFAERARSFREDAPTTAAQAAKIILDGVKAERWRILVGEDAVRLDQRVRATPEEAYERDFYENFAQEVGWRLG